MGMNLPSIRLIARDIKKLVAFYEAVTALPARWLNDDFAEIPTPRARSPSAASAR